jgi:hypothetical protein
MTVEESAEKFTIATVNGHGEVAARRRKASEDAGPLIFRKLPEIGDADGVVALRAIVVGRGLACAELFKEAADLDEWSDGSGAGRVNAGGADELAGLAVVAEVDVDEEAKLCAAELAPGVKCRLNDDIEGALGGKEQTGFNEKT